MHLRSRRARLLAATAVLLVPAGALAVAQPAAAAPTASVPIEGTLPQWLSKSATGARTLLKASPAKASKKLTIRVYLAPKGGEAAVQQAVAAVADPSSPTYGQYLTADQYRATYRPTKASVKKVSRWLKAKHLTVTGTEAERRYVTARGTVAHLDSAFGVTLTNLRHDGKKVIAPTTAARMPASVASSVLTVGGLDTTKVKMTHRSSPKVPVPEAFQNARPCSRYFGQVAATYQADFKTKLPKFNGATLPYVPCGYTGIQLRSAYTPGTTLDGAGVTVAITDAYRWQNIAKDAEYYAVTHGDGSYAKGQLTENLPKSYNNEDACDASGWSGEETLDVEAVHAMAPAAKIRYYASSSCFDDDFQATLARVVDENVAKVVSNSWADLEYNETSDAVVAYEQIFLQGALQGITFTFSSGDNGDELAASGFKQADYPSSDPYVTAVGGTSTGIGADGTRLFDTGWGTIKSNLNATGTSWSSVGFTSGAGGGYSSLFERPAYQRGVVPAADAPGRAVPDVALDADPNTGFLVGQTQKFGDGAVRYGEYRIGGTSLASPLFAGMTALTIQQNGGRGFGQLNPTLYKNTKVADDVLVQPSRVGVVRADYTDPADSSSKVVYSVRQFGRDSSLGVRKGWDAVTGLGVPNAGFLKLKTPAAPAAAVAKR